MNASKSLGTLLSNSIYAQLKLARVWQEKGKIERAIAGYLKVLELKPDLIQIYKELASLYLIQRRISELIAICQRGIEIDSSVSELHKMLITGAIEQGGFKQAFDFYQLQRTDRKKIAINSQDILCYAVIRNESLKLPFWLDYYRAKGVTKFLIVDNNSTDETANYLLAQPDVYTWSSTCSFKRSNCGSVWLEILLRKYGVNRWCLLVDGDEILYYPDCENKSINELCQELDNRHKSVFKTVLLDMYSDKAIADTDYRAGQNMLEVCPYFDRVFCQDTYEPSDDICNPYQNQTAYMGGVRARVFGEQGSYYLNKITLVKYNPDVLIAGGQHWTNLPESEIADITGCLLHFKYFASFINYVHQEVERKEHYGEASQYQEYAEGIALDEKLTLYDPNYSAKLKDSQQLIDLGIMHGG